MRVFMDDERDPPTEDRCGNTLIWDAVCRQTHEAIALLRSGKVSFISLDYWMHSGEMTGLDVARFILEGAKDGSIKKLDWDVHTGDTEKARLMYAVMFDAETAWEK